MGCIKDYLSWAGKNKHTHFFLWLAFFSTILICYLTIRFSSTPKPVSTVPSGIVDVYKAGITACRSTCSQRLESERSLCVSSIKTYQTQFSILRRKCHEVADLANDPDNLTRAINERLERLRLRRGNSGDP